LDKLILRPAVPEDAAALLAIYAPYVTDTAVTYEYDVPTVAEFCGRIEETLKRFPYLAAEKDGVILGYAYAGAFRTRAAYSRCAELSIYLSMDARRQGIGSALYKALEERLASMGYRNLYACIAWSETEDEYLSHDSVRFHTAMGFHHAGLFRGCAEKFGRLYDMVYMEKHI